MKTLILIHNNNSMNKIKSEEKHNISQLNNLYYEKALIYIQRTYIQ